MIWLCLFVSFENLRTHFNIIMACFEFWEFKELSFLSIFEFLPQEHLRAVFRIIRFFAVFGSWGFKVVLQMPKIFRHQSTHKRNLCFLSKLFIYNFLVSQLLRLLMPCRKQKNKVLPPIFNGNTFITFLKIIHRCRISCQKSSNSIGFTMHRGRAY